MNSVADDLRKNINYFNQCNPVSLNDKGDRYVIGDVEYPRVTGILGIIDKYGLRTWAMNQALDYIRNNRQHYSLPRYYIEDDQSVNDMETMLLDASKAHEEKRDTAADYGTEAHALLQQLTLDADTGVPEKFAPVVDAWQEWMDESGMQILATEQTLHYNKDGIRFAGTADLICLDKDLSIVIVDYKTGARIYPEYALQMAAYSLGMQDSWLSSNHEYSWLSRKQVGIGFIPIKAVVMRLPKEEGGKLEYKEVDNLDQQEEAFLHAAQLKLWQSGRNKWKRATRKVKVG